MMGAAWTQCGAAAAPASVRLWNADPLKEIRAPEDVVGSGPLRPVRLVGTRNAFCSAQVVATGEGLTGLSARVTDLVGPGGATIPASAVLVRYAARKQPRYLVKSKNPASDPLGLGEYYTNNPYCDILREAPPAGAKVVPIWLTVRVPADAAEGLYTGTLTVAGQAVPVRLEVHGWKAPDPRQFTTYVGFVESPESVAMQYHVPLWSERHFELLESSLRYLGEIGNKPVFVTAINRTHFGNDYAMIRWRKARGGHYVPDLSVMDRYLDLYMKYGGPPRPLVIQLWEPGFARRRGRRRRGPPTIPVTVVDADGRLAEAAFPFYGQPDSERVWKPLMDAIRADALRRGWPGRNIVLGCASDQRPSPAVVGFFKRIAPYARWDIWTHGSGDPYPQNGRLVLDGMEIGFYEDPYCPHLPWPLPDHIAGGWDLGLQFWKATCPRKFIFEYSPPSQYRNFAEGLTVRERPRWNKRPRNSSGGFTRIGLDFWDVKDGRPLLLRYHTGNWGNMYRLGPRAVLAPGPKGALSTVRYEMMREGVQECEARILIEKALRSDRIGGALADACAALLDERLKARLKSGRFVDGHGSKVKDLTSRLWGVAPNWHDLTARLFDLAAKVAEATGQGS